VAFRFKRVVVSFMTAVLCFKGTGASLMTALLRLMDTVMSLEDDFMSLWIARLRVLHAVPSLTAGRMSEEAWPENEMVPPESESHLAPRAMAA
jgi:hypothetical protein